MGIQVMRRFLLHQEIFSGVENSLVSFKVCVNICLAGRMGVVARSNSMMRRHRDRGDKHNPHLKQSFWLAYKSCLFRKLRSSQLLKSTVDEYLDSFWLWLEQRVLLWSFECMPVGEHMHIFLMSINLRIAGSWGAGMFNIARYSYWLFWYILL